MESNRYDGHYNIKEKKIKNTNNQEELDIKKLIPIKNLNHTNNNCNQNIDYPIHIIKWEKDAECVNGNKHNKENDGIDQFVFSLEQDGFEKDKNIKGNRFVVYIKIELKYEKNINKKKVVRSYYHNEIDIQATDPRSFTTILQ